MTVKWEGISMAGVIPAFCHHVVKGGYEAIDKESLRTRVGSVAIKTQVWTS